MKRKEIVPGSQPAYRSQLSYFNNLQDTDVSVTSSHIETCIPFFSLSDENNPIEFHIHSNPAHYINLKDSTLSVQLKVVKVDNSALTTTDKVSCVNLLLHSLFRECEIILNSVPIYSNGENYSIKSYLMAHLGLGSERKQTELGSALYYKDDDPSTVSVETDKGQAKRAKFLELSKVVELEGNLFCDLAMQSRYIPSGVHVVIRLKRNPAEFVLLTDPKTGTTTDSTCPYKIQILSCKLNVVKLTLDPTVSAGIQRNLESGRVARIPLKRSELRYLYIPSNLYSAVSDNLIVGQLPERILICLQETECLNGKIDKNPYSFKHHDVSSVVLTCDTEYTSTQKQINIDASSNLYLDAFRSVLSLISNPEIGNGISRDDFLKGNVFYVFDVRPRNSMSSLLTPMSGTVKVEIIFRRPISTPITVLIYSQYDGILNFDSNRTFSVESLSN